LISSYENRDLRENRQLITPQNLIGTKTMFSKREGEKPTSDAITIGVPAAICGV
jgi:hypothetical protein